MKQVLSTKITNIPGSDLFDNQYRFSIPENPHCDHAIDLAKRMEARKNESLDYSVNPKLWSEVYAPKIEWELFQEIAENALQSGSKVHIENISLAEEIEYVRDLYEKLGYFNEALNVFEPDFARCPITIGVNIRNLIYSFKDYYTLGKNAFFNPPPREPRHQKAIKSGVNAGIISTIHLNSDKRFDESRFFVDILQEEKTNLLKLGRLAYFNFLDIGYNFTPDQWIITLDSHE